MKIPDWFISYNADINTNLYELDILKRYVINHDCGKHLVKYIDDDGKVHYPEHALSSYSYWIKHNPKDIVVGKLILNDMFFHTCSANELENTELSRKELCTLLIASLAEIHANAEIFGGIESVSFKSKYKQIDRRGKKLCAKLFGKPDDYGHSYVFVRKDLSEQYRAVQAGHALIEMRKRFSPALHPSLVYVAIKNENKLKKVMQELIDNNVDYTLFREPLCGNEITCVATRPVSGKERELFKRYQLL